MEQLTPRPLGTDAVLVADCVSGCQSGEKAFANTGNPFLRRWAECICAYIATESAKRFDDGWNACAHIYCASYRPSFTMYVPFPLGSPRLRVL